MAGKKGTPDLAIILITIVLLGVGVVMVFSASSVASLMEHNDPYYYLKRQLLWAALGLLVMGILSHLDYRFYRRLAFPGDPHQPHAAWVGAGDWTDHRRFPSVAPPGVYRISAVGAGQALRGPFHRRLL